MKKGLTKKLLSTFLVGTMLSFIGCDRYGDDINSLTDRVDNIENSQLKSVNDQLSSIKSSISTLETAKTDLNTLITNAQTQLQSLQNKINANTADITTIKAQIVTLTASITALQTQSQSLSAEIDALQALSNTYATKTWAQATFATLTAQTDLAGKVSAIQTTLAGLQTKDTSLQSQIDALTSKLTTTENSIKSWVSTQLTGYYTIGQMDGKLDAIKAMLTLDATKNATYSELLKEVDARKQAIIDLRTEITAAYQSAINDAIQQNGLVTNTQLAEVATKVTNLETKVDDIVGRLVAVETTVANLIARIQSIVFVPEYNDGKATINFAKIGVGTTNYTAPSVLKYRVYPASAAMQIAKCYADSLKKNKSILYYDLQTVITRQPADPVLKIFDVKGDVDGVLTVTAQAQDMNALIVGTKLWAASLVLTDGNNNRSTEYTSMYANVQTLNFALLNPQTKTEIFDALNVCYTDYTKHQLPDSIFVGFTFGTNYYTYKDLTNLGYVFNAPVQNANSYVYSAGATATTFGLKDASGKGLASITLPTATTKLDIGKTVTAKYSYTCCGQTATITAQAVIVVYPGKVAMGTGTYHWNYLNDKQGDIDDLGDPSVHHTHDKVLITVGSQDLPSNVTVANVLAGTKGAFEIREHGKTTPAAGVVVNGMTVTGGKYYLEVTGFQWGKTYDYKIVYDVPEAHVTFSGSVSFVDRNRSELVVTKQTLTVNYVKGHMDKAVAVYDTIPEIISERGADLLLAGTIDKYRDLFVTGVDYFKNSTSVLKVNGNLATATTKLDYGYDGNLYIGFKMSDFTIMPTELSYTLTITTDYGQKISIIQPAKIILPSYDYKHNAAYISKDAVGYYAQVSPNYTPSSVSTAVSAFSVFTVDLSTAFDVTLDGNVLSPLPAGMVKEFSFATPPTSAGITMADNKISYKGKDEFVTIKALLYILDGTTKVILPTNFDQNGIYYGTRVKKFDPIGPLSTTTVEVSSTNGIANQVFNAMGTLSLKDNRGVGNSSYNVISGNNWVTGNGNNGFSTGTLASDIYGLTITYGDAIIPSDLKDNITFDKTTGILKFNHTNQLQLVQDYNVQIPVTIDYPYGIRKVTVVYHINK